VALVKKRPKISLLLPRAIHPGGNFEACVVLKAAREVPLDWVKVELRGVEQATFGSGKHSRRKRHRLLHLRADLCAATTLRSGRTELRCRFRLPADLPASFKGRRVKIRYEMTVRASIPWWPDARESFVVQVTQQPGSPQPRPARFASEGPSGKQPYLEGSLSSNVLWPGAMLTGAVALSNVAYNRYRDVKLSLYGREAVASGWSSHESKVQRYELRVRPPGEHVEGQPIPFAFAIPAHLSPAYKAELSRLDWFFEVRATIRLGSDLTLLLPMELQAAPEAGSESAAPISAPPSVGSPRLQELWRGVAAEVGLEQVGSQMQGRAGQRVSVMIRREHRGRKGMVLVGELRYPQQHLELQLRPATGLRKHLGGGVLTGDEPWDKDNYLLGRNAPQLSGFITRLQPTLQPFDQAQMDDTRLVVEHKGSGQKAPALRQFAQQVVALGRALDGALAAIPPPGGPGLDWDLPAWQACGRRLSGALETARMAVPEGSLDGQPASLVTTWQTGDEDDEPLCTTELSLHHGAALASALELTMDRDSDGLRWARGGAAVALDQLSELTVEARAQLEALAARVGALELSHETIHASIPGLLLDPAPALEALDAAARLGLLLRRSAGPYR
jgi:Arrestin (or S-antigen), N-terminal domain